MRLARKTSLLTIVLLTRFLAFSQTGTHSLNTDSLPVKLFHLQKAFPVKALIAPATFIGFGFASLHSPGIRSISHHIGEEVQEDMRGFSTKVDDYLKFAPAVTVFTLGVAGVKGKHNFLGKAILLTVSTALCSEVVTKLKHATAVLRPDGSTYNSFPSGHTATAFIGAEMMHQEYGSVSPWYSIAGYTMASGTAVLRILNNRHWLSDVVAGAGFGILSTKLTYWAFGKLEKKKGISRWVMAY